jgi:hypothetical protein
VSRGKSLEKAGSSQSFLQTDDQIARMNCVLHIAHIFATSLSIHCDYRSGGAINNQYVRILRCRSQLPLKYFHNIHLTNEV